MPEHRTPRDPFGAAGGDGGDGGRDETDDRIRALLTRAVAMAPPAPSAAEVRAPRLPAVSIALVSCDAGGSKAKGRGGRRPPHSGTARMLRAVAASIAIVVLAMAGARAIDALGGPGLPDADDRTAVPGDGLAARYIPTEVPPGLLLTGVDLSPTPDPDLDPSPDVAVYEGADGLRVRIAAGPTDWAARSAGPTLNSPQPGTTVPGTTLPPEAAGTGGPATTDGPAPTSTTTVPPTSSTPTTGLGATATTPTDTAPTTTVASLDAASLPDVPGVPGRPDIQATTVRGDVGGLEAHDHTTTTVWFPHQGELVAVDVYGLDQVAALGLVERLTPGADGRLVPAPVDGLRRVAGTPPRPVGAESPAAVQLIYTAAEGQVGGPAFVVTTVALAPGEDDLLTATAGSFGRIERWGDRQVLVDDGLDNGSTARVSFVDPAGVLVTVLGDTRDLASYVGGLVPADQEMWDQVIAQRRDHDG